MASIPSNKKVVPDAPEKLMVTVTWQRIRSVSRILERSFHRSPPLGRPPFYSPVASKHLLCSRKLVPDLNLVPYFSTS